MMKITAAEAREVFNLQGADLLRAITGRGARSACGQYDLIPLPNASVQVGDAFEVRDAGMLGNPIRIGGA